MTLAILGTGGHAKSIYDIVKNKKIYFFDKTKKKFKVGKKIFKVISNNQLIKNYKKKISKVVVAIGNNKIRKDYYTILKKEKFKFTTLIHPKSYSSIGSKIGEGSVIMQGSFINTDSIIGNNCIINSHASIDHDCLIEDHTHICPGVIIAGNVKVGKNCWIGLGTKIIENCVIGDNVFVAAGTLVTKNIKSNAFVKGVPAKYARKKLAKF
jgi:sugar O-acyltransferase (sialic acid O-acetyltransferase NeuD family)